MKGYLNRLNAYVIRKSDELDFNLTEVGSVDWE
jgi:hypothetical protein